MSAHKPELDQFTPAEIRVVCEQLLYTMDSEQRVKFMQTHPGLYLKLYPGAKEVLSYFTKHVNSK
jgi:hypothetical protein